MKDDYDCSLERVARSEDQLAKLTGFGTTKQGRALARRYCERLADFIGANRAIGRPKPVWKALRGIKDDDLEHVPPELNRQDSHGVLDRRFYRY